MEQTNAKKEKIVNIGMTENLMNFLDKWMEKYDAQEDKEKEEKPGAEVKKLIVEMMKGELGKVDEKLNEKSKLDDTEWFKLMDKVDKISDIVRWY